MDPAALLAAYHDFLTMARTVDESGHETTPPPGQWNADQILAHVTLVNAATVVAVSTVASGAIVTDDNRLALDAWTIERVRALAGGSVGLRTRIRLQGDALCAIISTLSSTELDTELPTLLLSNDTVLVHAQVPLRDLITGLTSTELPAHTEQLQSLTAGTGPA